MAEAKQLQVGDVIYRMSLNTVVSRMVITRVTGKRAFCGTLQFDRMPGQNGLLKEIGGAYSTFKYYSESPERADKWDRKDLAAKFDRVNVHGLSTDKLRRIIAIIEEKPGSVPSDHATGIPTLDRQNQ